MREVAVAAASMTSSGAGRIGVYAWQDPVVRVVAPEARPLSPGWPR